MPSIDFAMLTASRTIRPASQLKDVLSVTSDAAAVKGGLNCPCTCVDPSSHLIGRMRLPKLDDWTPGLLKCHARGRDASATRRLLHESPSGVPFEQPLGSHLGKHWLPAHRISGTRHSRQTHAKYRR